MEPFENHYDTLGVSHEATDSEIKKAYKRLAKVHHPDKKISQREEGGPRMSVAYDFKRLQHAYEVLHDPESKAAFDAQLALFLAEAERLAKQASKEKARIEAERAKERAAMEEKRAKEERRRQRKEKKEAERAAREAEELEETEKMSEELFVQQLYSDFGEAGDSAVFEMHSIDAHPCDADPEPGAAAEAAAAPAAPAAPAAADEAGVDESESDLKTPSQVVSQDPRMSDPRLSDSLEPQPRDSMHDLAQQMAAARFSDPVIDEGYPTPPVRRAKAEDPTLSPINRDLKKKHRHREHKKKNKQHSDPVLE